MNRKPKHKILRYHLTNILYNVEQDLKLYVLHYTPLEEPMKLIAGGMSYGELETFELVPHGALRHLAYVGMRDATDKEEREIEYKLEREVKARNLLDRFGEYYVTRHFE